MVSTNNGIVSIVDDELDITELFHDALSGISGISVFTFNDPILALKHFTNNKDEYVLVISDLRMPGLNGLELLKKAKSLNRYVRTILMSAFEVENDKVFLNYINEEIIDKFIQKPITLNHLCQEVNNQVQAYQLRMNE
jgi:DNA-binding NtrC family response regulator